MPKVSLEGVLMSQVHDVVSNSVKEKLQRGEVVASITIRLVPAVEIVRIAKTAGFDSLYIDLEHSSFSIETASRLCIMALEAGLPAFVRVPANTPEYISRVLDGGALGVIAPGVRSAAEARQVVAAAKYPPLGARGLSGALPHLQYRTLPAAQALPAMNEATMVIVQFESAAALAAMEEIVAVDGVDMVMIGSNDLLADLGIPGEYDHPKLHAAYEKTIGACRKRGKHVGVGGLASRADLVAKFVGMGAQYVSTGTDLGFLMAECQKRVKQIRDIKL
jgi:4-hydroxy-2-oxoheptanedioate aldolase